MGLINYLGCVRFNAKRFTGKDFANVLRKSYLDESEDPDISPYLVEGKLNVLSDEKFTLPGYFVELQHNSNATPFTFIKSTLFNFIPK